MIYTPIMNRLSSHFKAICATLLIAFFIPWTTSLAEAPTNNSPKAFFAPTPPHVQARAYILLDANSGRVLAEQNADEHLPPASLTKLMTIYIADEAFLSGTGAQLAWIASIDGRNIGTGKMGPVTGKLQKLFFSIIRGNERRYSSWLSKV